MFFFYLRCKKNSLHPNKLADICIFIHRIFRNARAVIPIYIQHIEGETDHLFGVFCFHSADDWKMEIADERTENVMTRMKKCFLRCKNDRINEQTFKWKTFLFLLLDLQNVDLIQLVAWSKLNSLDFIYILVAVLFCILNSNLTKWVQSSIQINENCLPFVSTINFAN